MTSENKFSGPLLIVGMGRSGTKLLQGLIDVHSGIALPAPETEFLPYWAEHWHSYGDMSDRGNFDRFFKICRWQSYFMFKERKGELPDPDKWHASCEGDFSLSNVFEMLVRNEIGVPKGSPVIWGAKAPIFINHLPMLHHHWPNARFVHIIRDVRDVCLSVHKAWGKSMIRETQRWVDGITKARMDAKQFPDQYLEIHYEELLLDPHDVMVKICNFLEVEFEARMLQLSRPTEPVGDAKGRADIVSNNFNKFVTAMEAGKLKKIEEIAGETLAELGYDVRKPAQTRRVGPAEMALLRVYDIYRHFVTLVKRKGFDGALRFFKSARTRA